MKFAITKGSTSVILPVFIKDSSQTDGRGLGSLDENSSIVGGYLKRDSLGIALAVDENVTTEGTYEAPSAAGKVRIGTPANMRTGTYELHFHNDLFTTKDWVTITLGGATNMAPLNLEVQLTGMDLNDSGKGGMSDIDDIKTQTDKLNNMIIEDSPGNQFSHAALENAPGTNNANTTIPPTVVQIRQEMDTNSTRLDADVSSRNSVTPDVAGVAAGLHATSDAIASDIKTQTDKLNNMIIEDSPGNQFTTIALENAPNETGGDATQAKQDTILANLATTDGKVDVVDGIVDDIKVVIDKLDDTLEDDSGTYRFTENALEEAPSGTGSTPAAFVNALMADTRFTQGGSLTWEKLNKLIAAWIAGNWRDKPTDSTVQELLDADDASTPVLEMVLGESTPYRIITIL